MGVGEILDIFLQMLEDGRLTVATGRTFDLRPKYVFMTSNLGSAAAARMRHNSDAAIEATVLAHARKALRPEFFNRVDVIGAFRRLKLREQGEICRLHVDHKIAGLQRDGLDIQVDEDVYQFLLGEGFSEVDGFRPLRRAIETFVNRPIRAA